MYYKTPDNSLHDDMGGQALSLPVWPKDAVPISDEEADAIRAVIAAANVPPINSLKTNSIGKVKELRRVVFASLAGLQSEALASGDLETASGILPVQEALKNLPQIDLSACQTQADIDATFLAAWKSIVSITPLKVVSAFNELKDSF